jgi:hypothetical protein
MVYLRANDTHVLHQLMQLLIIGVMRIYERYCPKSLREAALKHVYSLILMEEENTGGVDLGPVINH